jgi:predicted RNA binding protein YcfA (HicA-like mRNA interferase family)
MNFSPQHLCKLLEQHGYLLKRIKGSHHIYFHPQSKKVTIVPVHGNKDLARGTFFSILKQAGISKDEV